MHIQRRSVCHERRPGDRARRLPMLRAPQQPITRARRLRCACGSHEGLTGRGFGSAERLREARQLS
ncbi:MAG TPA: hypothetical protein VGD00_08705 [Solirubrobacteraceae bacterium]|jgi:hypothetical protein